ncbi:DivIVA domain-containing protein [Arthrobacter sp. H14-L1]|uniref:DivIVA domain-containing protein n=1 Tax=Arthrobacter sp. H14-L1 TaxID=2996697 RepID=UPI00227121A4|nr:DivIVA domain-containing protein [Arthrobacter sp. H14-L1]MCY0904250.1 DivIVA domain-containing protein [Arthrobacter sp. H14-L1]
MALTPEDVVNKRFQPTKFREGYDQDEVDDFLDEIVVELRRLTQENEELRKKLAAQPAGSASAASVPAPIVEKIPAGDSKSDDVKAETKAAKSVGKGSDIKGTDIKGSASPKSDAASTSPVPPVDTKAASAEATPAPAAAAPAATAPTANAAGIDSAAGVLAMAQRLHDEYVNAGVEQRDKIIAEAQVEASSLVNDAQEKSRKTLGALEQQRSVLERKVEQLRGFERDYRARLKAYIEGQLRDLDARGSVASADVSDSNADS